MSFASGATVGSRNARFAVAKRVACPACSRNFVRGAVVWFASRTGLRRTRVCQKCAAAGVTIVQDKSGDFERCAQCEKNAATVCTRCMAAAVAVARRGDYDK